MIRFTDCVIDGSASTVIQWEDGALTFRNCKFRNKPAEPDFMGEEDDDTLDAVILCVNATKLGTLDQKIRA